MKKIKKFLVFAAILSFSLLAFSSGAVGTSAEEPLKLTLQEAVEIALKNNPSIGLSELAVEKAKLKKDQLRYREKKVEEQDEELRQLYGMSITKDFEYEYSMEMGKKAADMELKLAQLGVEAAKNSIRFGVEAAYYAALSARDKVEIARESLERAREMERIAQALYENGSATKKDLLDAQVKLSTAEAELKKAEVEMEKAYIDLKKLLKLDMARQIELSEGSEFKAVEKKVDLNELLEKARKNRIDLVQAREQLDLAKYDFEMTQKVYPSNTFQYKEKEYALKQAELNYQNVESQIEQEVRKAYLDYTAAASSLPILEKSLEMAEESYRIARLSYEAGLIRSVDLAQAEEAVKQVKLQKAGAIYSYNLAALYLDNVIYMSISQ
ncbi:MAG: TolC family protein [Bacillota bacterium]